MLWGLTQISLFEASKYDQNKFISLVEIFKGFEGSLYRHQDALNALNGLVLDELLLFSNSKIMYGNPYSLNDDNLILAWHLCYGFVSVSSYVPCGHLLGKG